MKSIYFLFGMALTFSGITFFTAEPLHTPQAPTFSVPNYYKRAGVLAFEQDTLIRSIRENMNKAADGAKEVVKDAKQIRDKRRAVSTKKKVQKSSSIQVRFTSLKSEF